MNMAKLRKQTKITMVLHPSSKNIVLSYFRWKYPKLTDDKILKKHTDFTIEIEHVRHTNARVSQLLEAVEYWGLWAYCKHFRNKSEKEIHYWISEKAVKEQILEIIGHELAHAFGYTCEKTAQKVGAITAFANQIYEQDILKKVSNPKNI